MGSYRYVCAAPKSVVLSGFGLKMDVDFSPMSAIAYGKSQVLV